MCSMLTTHVHAHAGGEEWDMCVECDDLCKWTLLEILKAHISKLKW